MEGRSCLSTHFSFSVASSASTVALARVMVGVVRVEEGGRGDCVCALGSMCEGDTLRSSLHKKPSLTVGRLCLLSPAGVWRKEHIISLIRLHMAALVILPTLLARLVVRLISNPVGILSLILGIAVPPVRGCVCEGGEGGGTDVEVPSTIILYNLVRIIFSFPPSIQASLHLPFPHVPSSQ